MEILPNVGEVSKVAGILTSGGFLILAGSIIMVFITQLLKMAVVQIKNDEVSGDMKKVFSAITLLFVTCVIGYIKQLSITENGNEYLSIFGMIGYVSSMIYRFGLRWLFNRADFTTTKILEAKEENLLLKEELKG